MTLSAQDLPNFPDTAKGHCELTVCAYERLGAEVARSVEAFLLPYGEEFGGATLPDYISAGTPQMCFMNCHELADEEESLTYCEGFVVRVGVFPITIHHAWLLGPDGETVIEPTITDKPEELSYFGVRLPMELVDDVTRVTRSYSVLGKRRGHEAIEKLFDKGEEGP